MAAGKTELRQKTFGLLEFGAIMEKVALCAHSEEAARLLREETPLYDPARLDDVKKDIQAIFERINSGDDEPRSSLPSIGFLFPKLGVEGMVLELDEAYAIGLFIESGAAVRKWLGDKISPDSLDEAFPGCAEAAAEIFKIVDRSGNARDLPCLRAIKQRIQSLDSELRTSLARYFTDEDSRRMLQQTIPSQRDGRAVLAVKANFRRRVQGIVHEVSSTGQTVFIEPAELVEKNNELLIEKRNLDAELRRVMRELTAQISAHGESIKQFHRAVIEIECLRAKARYSRETKGCFARNDESGDLILKQARHPLLAKPVPIDLSMERGIRALVITGPNTGGKTVSLKTVGLFALMNQCGLALPAEEGTALPVFDGVFADIGDEQSIGQSLSTFSAHINSVAGIIEHSTGASLVLLDELGAGTDPSEGSAIAMAVLDHFIDIQARLIVTTHHGVLKNYGYSRRGVENASVEFDSRTLSPTYRIINGIPGESRALDIAGKNGLPQDIIDKASAYLEDGRSDVSALISGLKEKHRELDKAAMNSRAEQEKLREDRRRSDLLELKLRQKEMELKQGGLGKLRLLLDESRKTLENLVREVREGELSQEKTRRVKEFLESLDRATREEKAVLDEEENALAELRRRGEKAATGAGASGHGNFLSENFAPGVEVTAGEQRRKGTIVRLDKKTPAGNIWIVEIGSLKISFPEKDLRIQSGTGKKTKPRAPGWTADIAPQSDFRIELNLRGMRLEEALEALRRQIDSAVIAGLREFSVVHGKGDGILQKGVHDYLKAQNVVADYFFSRPEAGGFGRTEVILK